MTAQLPLALVERPRVPRVLSYGGGLDSFAMLLRALDAGAPPDVVCFVDVGDPEGKDPGEWRETYDHMRTVVRPLCERAGVEFVWIDATTYPVRDARSLFAWLEARRQIPVAGPNRICTRIAKVERFERWMSDRWPGREVEVWIGFEAGEEDRARKDPNAGSSRTPRPGEAVRRNRFPLIEAQLCRCRCDALVRTSGFPVPPGSACKFCPYASKGAWQRFAAQDPAGFARTVQLEAIKPPTARGIKLSIMNFRTRYRRVAGVRVKVGHSATPLPEFIRGTYRPKPKPCGVCGAAQRTPKAFGCAEAA